MIRHFAIGRLCVLALATFLSLHAGATAQRTFVSGSGVDNPACSIASPCRSFAAAVVAASDRGEVIVLDSAGYGPVSITKSISIIAPSGICAGISVFSGNGVTIDGTDVEVTLRGLAINGLGGALIGIQLVEGRRVVIDRCTITNVGADAIRLSATNAADATIIGLRAERISGGGVNVLAHVDANVIDSLFSRVGTGILVGPASAPSSAHIERNTLEHCTASGIVVDGTMAFASADASGNQIVDCSVGVWAKGNALAYATGNRIIASSVYGVFQSDNAFVVTSENVITGNVTAGIAVSNPGLVYSFKNNVVRDDTTNIINGPLAVLTFD